MTKLHAVLATVYNDSAISSGRRSGRLSVPVHTGQTPVHTYVVPGGIVT